MSGLSHSSRHGLAPQSSVALGGVWGLVRQALAPAAKLAARISMECGRGQRVCTLLRVLTGPPRWLLV